MTETKKRKRPLKKPGDQIPVGMLMFGPVYRQKCEANATQAVSKSQVRRLKKYLSYTTKTIHELCIEQINLYRVNYNDRKTLFEIST